jgi:hypothetical protein
MAKQTLKVEGDKGIDYYLRLLDIEQSKVEQPAEGTPDPKKTVH